ncbi:MAG: GAF domain-containing protein [Desulfobacteraceae bacterium]|uniref:GAF domain-containing protein n=1 Tax=Candidatus Desulfacyla euxinica TaxID=2841693 RepID=A0A8J6T2R3_9DELT|nr:GAF domain-containing protein [Candidatus Desulfacyla euxinica]MBL6977940.1 GAF domain-containing protein [Desulfobacteraceae bacterium]MBL7217063.1 GAF domain-containing protein [Desulfobacteraceae bacterium]
MTENKNDHPFRSTLSLEPLLGFWRKHVSPACPHMGSMFEVFEARINETPALKGAIKNVSVFENYQDLLIPLMSVVFPAASSDTEVSGALIPCTSHPFYVSPKFKQLMVGEDGFLKGSVKNEQGVLEEGGLLRAYFMVLDKIYGFKQGLDTPIIRIVQDQETGLDRCFRITLDLQFVEVRTVGEPKKLTEKEREIITENITDIEILSKFIDPEEFEFYGFSVIRAVDVTESEVISALEKDLIDQQSIFSADGFKRLQARLRILFRRPDLMAGIGALQGDKVLVLSDGCKMKANCIFTNSNHIPMSEIEGSVWLRAVEQGSILRISDLKEEPDLTPTEQLVLDMGCRSMLISPLSYQGEAIGTLEIMSPHPRDLGAIDEMLVKQITPIFSVALKRGLDEMNNNIQAIIKEKCTAVHPSVEWRFQKAAFSHMDRLRVGQASDMEPIIFKDVIPFYAQSDIRGSSEGRNMSIQSDLTEQLNLSLDIMKWAEKAKSWPLISEFKYRIEKRIEGLRAGLASDEEASISHFLSREVEPTFEDLLGLGPRVVRAVETYRKAIDPIVGAVYRKRREFEESVSILNETLSAYLSSEEAETQSIFPHYFEKRQTDGIDYMMYVGASMMENGKLSNFHVKNLGLWQLIVACGMAQHTEQIKPELKVPLETCHLILVNHTPLSIRFRYDEKRFDVDGAYDVRHEIIKSRIDKAVVKRTGERLTQPGRVAIVYSHTDEGREMQRHIDFLKARGNLLNDLEFLDLDDLPGVRGLKALRVGINLETQALARTVELAAG